MRIPRWSANIGQFSITDEKQLSISIVADGHLYRLVIDESLCRYGLQSSIDILNDCLTLNEFVCVIEDELFTLSELPRAMQDIWEEFCVLYNKFAQLWEYQEAHREVILAKRKLAWAEKTLNLVYDELLVWYDVENKLYDQSKYDIEGKFSLQPTMGPSRKQK